MPLALLFALAQASAAQTPVNTRGALAAFPDSQAVLFINSRRIVNEMLPRVMPPAEYKKMVAQAQQVGLDLRGLEYAAIGIRLADPPPANGLPEFVVVLKGGFNADSLLALGRVALSAQTGKTRRESYGTKSLEIIDTQNIGNMMGGGGNPDGSADKPKPPAYPYPEIAVTALDSSTLVIGVPAYVKAAVDSAGGQGGLSGSTLDLAANDPQALWSFTAVLPPSLADYLHKAGVPPNQEADQMLSWVKQLSIAQGMDALNFTLSAALLTDAPEHASAFSGLIRMGLLAAQTGMSQEIAKKRGPEADQMRQALDTLKTLVNRTDGNTLHLSVSVSQKTVADLVRKEMVKTPPTTKTGPRTTRRRGRTRR
ncbi:MAG: hypothetical protein QOC99_571 [Acidobacteriota bacterium]|jgi:hypothetical protein|nr:hypothetical protein [Acidobacteriota bacterium]